MELKQVTNSISLNTLLRKPDASQVHEKNEKTLALKIMSLDLNTLDAKKWRFI